MSVLLIYTKWNEQIWAHSVRLSTPCVRPVKLQKSAIAPERVTWSLCLFRHTFRYAFLRGSRPPCIVAFTFVVSAVVDVFHPSPSSHSWNMCSPGLILWLCILWTLLSRQNLLQCCGYCWVGSWYPSFVGQTDSLLGRPNHVSLAQVGLYSLWIHNTYGFRAFSRVSGEYFTLNPKFSLNLLPSLMPFFLCF